VGLKAELLPAYLRDRVPDGYRWILYFYAGTFCLSVIAGARCVNSLRPPFVAPESYEIVITSVKNWLHTGNGEPLKLDEQKDLFLAFNAGANAVVVEGFSFKRRRICLKRTPKQRKGFAHRFQPM